MYSLIGQKYSTIRDLLEDAQKEAMKHGFAVATKSSNARTIYIRCVHGGSYRNTHNVSEETRKQKGSTKKLDCEWEMYAALPKNSQQWVVKRVDSLEKHNHDVDSNNAINYHQHRVIGVDMATRIAEQSRIGVPPAKIYETLRSDNGRSAIKVTDIYKYKEKYLTDNNKNEVSELVEYLENRNYTVAYGLHENGKKLAAMFICHPISVEKAQQFPEVVIVDATYKTNSHKMPMVNVVGISNLGTTKLRTFLIASVLITSEKETSYNWVAQQMREHIFPNKEPGLFVTDDERALTNALNEEFPSTPNTLCCWHVLKNFEKHAAGHFDPKSDERESFIKAVQQLLFSRTESKFTEAKEAYAAAVEKSKKTPAELKQYLNLYVHRDLKSSTSMFTNF